MAYHKTRRIDQYERYVEEKNSPGSDHGVFWILGVQGRQGDWGPGFGLGGHRALRKLRTGRGRRVVHGPLSGSLSRASASPDVCGTAHAAPVSAGTVAASRLVVSGGLGCVVGELVPYQEIWLKTGTVEVGVAFMGDRVLI